jgi:hypothetical protein
MLRKRRRNLEVGQELWGKLLSWCIAHGSVFITTAIVTGIAGSQDCLVRVPWLPQATYPMSKITVAY